MSRFGASALYRALLCSPPGSLASAPRRGAWNLQVPRRGAYGPGMDLSRIPVGENPPHEVNVIIEIPQGGAPVKYEIDKQSGAMFVDRFLHTAMFYPANYGFIPHT